MLELNDQIAVKTKSKESASCDILINLWCVFLNCFKNKIKNDLIGRNRRKSLIEIKFVSKQNSRMCDNTLDFPSIS